MLASGTLGVGGGEATVDLPPDRYALYLGVFPPGGAVNDYIINVNPACPEGDACSNGNLVSGTCRSGACSGSCVATGPEVCDGRDNDCNGTIDDDWVCGVELPDSDVPALDLVYDFTGGGSVADDDWSEIEDGYFIARTVLEIEFDIAVSARSVNQIVASVGGRIISMLEGTLLVTIGIPDPGPVQGLYAVADGLRELPGVDEVILAPRAVKFVIPEEFGDFPPFDKLARIEGQLALRSWAAWNAKGVLQNANRLTLLLGDFFGREAPRGAAWNVRVVNARDFEEAGEDDGHGYEVLSVVSANFGGGNENPSRPGLVTGMFPAKVDLRACDHVGRTFSQVANCMVAVIRSTTTGTPPRRLVLNTSIGDPPRCIALTEEEANEVAEAGAMRWLRRLRGSTWLPGTGVPGSSLEHRFLHVAAAGNNQCPESQHGRAEIMAPWNWAATKVVDTDRLTNTIVVEARDLEGPRPVFGCLQPHEANPLGGIPLKKGSSVGGTVSAGRASTLLGPSGSVADNSVPGTSTAAPQVAGVGLYVWSVAPQLTPQRVKQIIESTATAGINSASCAVDPGAPAVDAYAAVLAADPATDISRAEVRRAILQRR